MRQSNNKINKEKVLSLYRNKPSDNPYITISEIAYMFMSETKLLTNKNEIRRKYKANENKYIKLVNQLLSEGKLRYKVFSGWYNR